MGDLLGAGVLFLLGWLMQGKGGKGAGPAPRTPREVPWPQEGQRPLTKEERAAVQAAIPEALFSPLKQTPADKAKAAAASAFGPSPLSDVSEYRKATRPGGKVVAPDLPKSEWREPGKSEWGTDEGSLIHTPKA